MFRRRKLLSQLDGEIRDYLERETLDNIDRGMAPGEARYAALRKFGNVERIKEQTREVWAISRLTELLQDFRYGLRMLRRNPSFATIAILTLALGIGVNAAVFSVINTVLLRPLPYPDADRIVAFSTRVTSSSNVSFKAGILGADFADWRTHAKSFQKLAGYFYGDETVSTAGTAAQVRVVSLAGDFWTITGVHTMLGRLFEPEASQNSVVLSYWLFKRQFKADPGIVGRVITLDGKPMIVVGVLPRDFRFLFPQNWWSSIAAVEPGAFISAPPLVRSKPSRLFVVAHLKPLISAQTALAEIRGVEAAILKSNPDRWFPGVSRMRLVPLQTQLVGSNRQALLILQVAGLFVLLIACTNIANLLLARAAARDHEIAIRASIGAGAMRMLRQFLAEGIVLALLSGIAGLLIAKWLLVMLLHFGGNAIPRLLESAVDLRVLAFTLALCLGSGILFGFAPALSLSKPDLQNALKEGAKNSSLGLGGLRGRRFLVASELALAIILLTGACLMVKSFWKMYTNPPGFAPEKTLVMQVSLSGPQYADKARQVTYFKELLHRLGSMPGVRAFGIANIEDYLFQSANSAVSPAVNQFRESLVSPGYFQAVGMHLLKGRWLTDTDPPDATVINQTMARRVFGDRNPIGKNLEHLSGYVIGVVGNLKYAKRDADPGPEMFQNYLPNLGGGNITMTVVVRLLADPLGLVPALRKSIMGIDPAQPVYNIQSLKQVLADSVSARRFDLFLLATFAIAALLMAVVGVYGMIAYTVTQRTREIGIRVALGAQRGSVVRMIVAEGIGIGLCGILIGLLAALALTRLMGSLLYGVTANDPATFAAAAIALSATVLLASWVPAVKASLVDPLISLRYE